MKRHLILLASIFSVMPLTAAEFIVTNTADSGNGSLRDAISSASSGDTITFNPGFVNGIIVLNGTQITIDKDLTIDASAVANGITISGNDASRVFFIESGKTVTMESLTIERGLLGEADKNGGGIYNNGGTLTLRRCTLANNSAYSAPPQVSVDISGGHGGGIYSTNGGTVNLELCTVANNRAGNAARSSNGGQGGGVWIQGGQLSLTQCTVAGNISGANGGQSGGQLVPGGGIFANPFNIENIVIADSIVAGNTGASDMSYYSWVDVDVTRDGINIVGSVSFINGGTSATFPLPGTPGQPNANGDFVGSTDNPLDPLLGELADNGGPTQTMLPLRGSPAVDPVGGSGTSTFPTDQRGFDRIVGGVVDVGAVEAPYAAIDAAARAEANAAAAAAAQAAAAARAQAAARAAQLADFSKKIKKLKKKSKDAKRKGQAAKSKKFKAQIKKLTKQLRAL